MRRPLVSVQNEGKVGAVFRIEGRMTGLSLNGARRLALELEERIAQHERAYSRAQAIEADAAAVRYRLQRSIARS